MHKREKQLLVFREGIERLFHILINGKVPGYVIAESVLRHNLLDIINLSNKNMKQKGSVNSIVVILIIVLIIIIGYVMFYQKPSSTVMVNPPITSSVTPETLPSTCKDETEGIPVITSFSKTEGIVGTQLEIRGCNFAGFEGDKNASIENTEGVVGFLKGEAGSTNNLIKVTLKSPLCTKDNSYSGLPCTEWLTLKPGTYKIFTNPWGKKSNIATFTIK